MSSRLNPARLAAARACIAVEEGAHLEDVLAKLAPVHEPDRSLAWFLAYGIQRCRGRVDVPLRANLKQALDGLEAPVRAALRLGSFELQFARTGDHAAVHQAVEVIKALRLGRASGLVNAVLRKVRPGLATGADAVDAPPWLYHRWGVRYGREAADRWLAATTEPPPLFIVAKDDVAALSARLVEAGVTVKETAVPGVLQLVELRGRIEELPGFDDGAFWVQDLASVQVADLAQAQEGHRILDACAAPGGKSFRMAATGATVFATDRSPARLAQMRGSLERLDMTVRLKTWDWTEGAIADVEPFDTVVVDAPCTAVGTIRRHPEIKWRRQLVDVLAMAPIQSGILNAAATHVRSGGALVYAVCSPEPEEGQAIVEAFTAEHPEFTVERTLCTAPPEHGEDAFFGARWVRA